MIAQIFFYISRCYTPFIQRHLIEKSANIYYRLFFLIIFLHKQDTYFRKKKNIIKWLGLDARKPYIWGFANNKCAVWSAPLLFTIGKYQNLTSYRQVFNCPASLCRLGDWFKPRFVGNPEDRFCRVDAQVRVVLLIRKFSRGFYFRETSHMRSFAIIKPSRNDEITQSFTDIGKTCLSRELLTSQICLKPLFAKIKFSRQFPNLQYLSHLRSPRLCFAAHAQYWRQ